MKNTTCIILIFSLINFVQPQTSNANPKLMDSVKVESNSITFAGASIGISTASSMLLLAGISSLDGNLSSPEFTVMMLGPGFINGVVIPNYLNSENKGFLRAGMLVSSCATAVMPMLGAMFGAPNSDLSTVATMIAMGTIAGAIYNHALALVFPKYREALKSAKIKKRKIPVQNK